MMHPTQSSEASGRRLSFVAVGLSSLFIFGCAAPHHQAGAVAADGQSTDTSLPPLVASDQAVDRAVLRMGEDACAADPAACSSLAAAFIAMSTADDSFDIAAIAADSGCSRGDSASCEVAIALRAQPADASREARVWSVLLAACVARPSPECAGVTRWHLATGLGDPDALRRLGAALAPQCGDGSAPSCGAAGDVAWIARDSAEARAWYERGCEAGDGHSCWMLAWAWGSGAFGAQDRARSAARFREACYKGHARGCLWGASALAQGWGHEQELYIAAVLMDLACLRGDRAGCGNLGDSLHAYARGPQVRLRSSEFRLDRLDCVANSERCFYAALQHFVASRDVEALRRVADVTCQRGEYTACVTIEAFLRRGIGAGRPARDGVFDEPCERGEYSACLALEVVGAPWSPEGGQSACNGGNLLACLDVIAHTGASPNLVPIVFPRRCDGVAACAVADAQCRQGSLGACTSLGYQLAFDGSISQEPGRAALTFYRACQSGDVDACYRIGQLELATGEAAARSRAIRRIHDACRTGHALACLQSWRLGSAEYRAVEFACGEGLALACLTGPDGEPTF